MRRVNEEGGVVAVIVGILIVALLGFAALAIDVGRLYQERRELQNGADAGALAIAENCARDTIDCIESVVTDVADEYADENAEDDASYVEDLALDADEDYEVTVDLLSEDGDTGDHVVHHWFAPVLGIESSEVRASATARWGPAVAAEGFPFGVCEKLWEENRPDPDGPGPRIDVRFKGTGEGADPVENKCLDEEDDDFDPGTEPGNFSWLDQEDDTCTTEYDFSDGSYTASGDTGVDIPSNCQDEVDDMIDQIHAHKDKHGDVVYDDPADNDLPIKVLPIYSTVEGEGTNATYTLVTLGAFEFSGMKMKGGQNVVVEEWDEPLCTGTGNNHLCVQGRFVKEVAIDGAIDFGSDSDVLIVKLVD